MFSENVYFCPYCGVKTNNNICCEICSNELKKFVNKNIGKTEFCDAFTAPFVYDDIVRDAMLNLDNAEIIVKVLDILCLIVIYFIQI